MKLSLLCVAATVLLDSTVSAIVLPEPASLAQYQPQSERDAFQDLWKRRGGGGSGGRGGSGSGSSSGSSGSGSSSGSSGSSSGSSGSSGSSSGSSSSGSSSGRGSSSSSTGGQTKGGSGVRPAYGGGSYYGGGATTPYRAGGVTPFGLSPLPFLFAGAAIAFWPGLWLHPAYMYPYSHPWAYHNATNNMNETKPVLCACDETEECGCEDNSNSTYINSVIGNGSYDAMNKSLVTVANVNGTDTILINGTLPNGTTADGGTEDPNAAGGMRMLLQQAGWWPVAATVVAMVFFA